MGSVTPRIQVHRCLEACGQHRALRWILNGAKNWNLGLGFDSVSRDLALHTRHIMPVISTVGRWNQEDQKFKVFPKLFSWHWAQMAERCGRRRESGFGSSNGLPNGVPWTRLEEEGPSHL